MQCCLPEGLILWLFGLELAKKNPKIYGGKFFLSTEIFERAAWRV